MMLAPLPDLKTLTKPCFRASLSLTDTHFQADFVFCTFAVTGNQ